MHFLYSLICRCMMSQKNSGKASPWKLITRNGAHFCVQDVILPKGGRLFSLQNSELPIGSVLWQLKLTKLTVIAQWAILMQWATAGTRGAFSSVSKLPSRPQRLDPWSCMLRKLKLYAELILAPELRNMTNIGPSEISTTQKTLHVYRITFESLSAIGWPKNLNTVRPPKWPTKFGPKGT